LKDANIAQDPKGGLAFTVQVEGPHEAEHAGHRDRLLSQLKKIPKGIQFLQIKKDTPSNTEWSLLGNHFTSIKNLEMDTGFNENLNDESMPLHWPLERLLVSSACAEVFRSRFVIEGKVKHLILLLTSGLRFEGPTTDELCRADREAIARGEKEPKYITLYEGTPEEKKLELTVIHELVLQYMEKYAKLNGDLEVNEDRAPTSPFGPHSKVESELASASSNQQVKLLSKEVTVDLTKLEILENDSIDTFNRMTLALPYVIANVSTVNIRSTHGLDFHFTTEELFSELIPQLTELKTFVLSVGEVFKSDRFLPTLYKHFPPNISTLRFRGPVSLARSNQWIDWIDSFASSEFLPKLKRLSFVLDLHYEAQNASESGNLSSNPRRKLVKAPDKMLQEAQEACERLYIAVEQRRVMVEPFHDEWSEHSKRFNQVDERWMKL
jgi:hypothetical protein